MPTLFRLLADAGAQSTVAAAITNSQTSVTLGSATGFPAIATGGQISVIILPPGFDPNNPVAPGGYEYQQVNAISGNVLTFGPGGGAAARSSYAGTTPRAFLGGATVAAVMLAEDFAASSPWKIGEIVASGSPTSLTFSGIPQTYRSLLVTGRVKTTTTTVAVYTIGVSLLGDVGNFYSATQLSVAGKGTNTTLVGSQAANQANASNALLGATSATDATAALSASFAAWIPNYRDTSTTKHWMALEVLGDSTGPNIYLFGGSLGQSTAITTLTFAVADGFTGATVLELYGLP